MFFSRAFTLLSLVSAALAAAPTGSYEGSVTKLGQTITTHVDVVDESKMNLKISGMFSIDCPEEAYTISGSDISVDGAETPGNCVHDGLDDNHVKLDGITYDEAGDEITVAVKSLGMSIDTVLVKQQAKQQPFKPTGFLRGSAGSSDCCMPGGYGYNCCQMVGNGRGNSCSEHGNPSCECDCV
jgi:hypothetical protein